MKSKSKMKRAYPVGSMNVLTKFQCDLHIEISCEIVDILTS